MNVKETRDLLVYELGVALAAEKAIAKMLTTLKNAASDRELAQGFERHRDETRQHAKTVGEALELLGKRPRGVGSPAVEGIEAEYEAFARSAADDVPPHVGDLIALTAAMHVEHYEIAAYESLIIKAQAMDEPQLVQLLNANLAQEQLMLQRGRIMEQRLGHAAAMEIVAAEAR